MIAAGLGCRLVCEAGELLELLRQAEAACGHRAAMLGAPWFRAGHAGLLAAADRAGLPLHWLDEPALRAVQHRCPTRSARTLAETGLASIAEACALALAGGTLLLPRIASAAATCALARL